MATIHSLNRSILDMCFEEALALIRKIRTSRSIPKKAAKVKVGNSGTRKRSVKPTSTKDLINQLSTADKLALMKILEGDDK